MRDKHNRLKDCEFFKKEKCQFPDNICLDKHESTTNENLNEGDMFACHTCKKEFITTNRMMINRSENHPEKLKPCRDQDDCTRRVCWYKHEKKDSESDAEVAETGIEWINKELDSETEGFQGTHILPKPPSNQ